MNTIKLVKKDQNNKYGKLQQTVTHLLLFSIAYELLDIPTVSCNCQIACKIIARKYKYVTRVFVLAYYRIYELIFLGIVMSLL